MIPAGRTFIKPDIIILNDDGIAEICDVTVPFEYGPASLVQAEEGKEGKYQRYEAEIASWLQSMGRTAGAIRFRGIAFGARGAIRNRTINWLMKKGISKSNVRSMLRNTVRASWRMVETFSRLPST